MRQAYPLHASILAVSRAGLEPEADPPRIELYNVDGFRPVADCHRLSEQYHCPARLCFVACGS